MTVRSRGPLAMQRVRRGLERWRRTRPHPRAPIPDGIWAGAIGLARQYGVSETARALAIDYGALKRQLEAADRTAMPDERSGFVELTPLRSTAWNQAVIEVGGPRASVRIRLHGIELPALARLSRVIAGLEA